MKVRERVDVRVQRGEVGIEIEVEGSRLVGVDNEFWRTEHDGSLRGESAEFVLKSPVPRRRVVEALESLSAHFRNNNCQVEESPRAGTHIHINVQEMEISEMFAFLTAYLCFEEVLVKWCGESRYGNLFCLTASQAEGALERAITAARSNILHRLHTDQVRYGSCNLKAVSQYGSLEFRSMRGTTDVGVISKWVRMLLCLKDYAAGKTPYDITHNYSVMGPQDFFNAVLGEFRDDLNPSTQDLVTGMRNAQEISYCKDWNAQPAVVEDILDDEDDDEEAA